MLRADAAEAELARLKASPSSERDTEKLVEALREIAKYDSATAAGQDLVQYLVGIAREALAEFSAPPAGAPDDKEQP